jgi:acyl-CoA thioester hydrolase
MAKVPALNRSDFPKMIRISTRWSDNDVYQHVNNVVYFSFFDTAVNQYLLEQGLLDLHSSKVVGLVVDNHCQFFSSIAFPDEVFVGIAVEKIGNSSVVYRLGVFKNQQPELCALGRFTHVYVNREDLRPTPIPGELRAALTAITHQWDDGAQV